tara:strand:+ start:266 stop:685 length:420 start_codon:yes stop_codon:yes gene_type:complete
MTEKKKKKNLGKINRRKGHNAERHYANWFKQLGYKLCQTSRYGSRLYDDCGIDLINIPFLVQVKAGKQKNLNIISELKNIKEKVAENFPKESREQELPRMLIHRKDVGRGRKRTSYDDIITMTAEDFKILIKLINNNDS